MQSAIHERRNAVPFPQNARLKSQRRPREKCLARDKHRWYQNNASQNPSVCDEALIPQPISDWSVRFDPSSHSSQRPQGDGIDWAPHIKLVNNCVYECFPKPQQTAEAPFGAFASAPCAENMIANMSCVKLQRVLPASLSHVNIELSKCQRKKSL